MQNNDLPLGKYTEYIDNYCPSLLRVIPRATNRSTIGINHALPFTGDDHWTLYELSWLNPKGKPVAAVGTLTIPCHSQYIVESKSLKCYLHSFNNTVFESMDAVRACIQKDLSKIIQTKVTLTIAPLSFLSEITTQSLLGIHLDTLDVSTTQYTVDPSLLKESETNLQKSNTNQNEIVTEILYSDLLKSNCLVTKQPDWASVQIGYTGQKINHAGLLRYIISYRNHCEFHEHCVERMFMDILQQCKPNALFIQAHFTRRGGIAINPCRFTRAMNTITIKTPPPIYRLARQ